MASVKKRSRSPFWSACYTDGSGRRVQKSTGLKDRDEALRMALQLQRAASLARRGELSEARARVLISELLEQFSDGRETVRAITVGKYLSDWIDSKLPTLSEGSRWSYRRPVALFLDWLGKRKKSALNSIQPADARAFLASVARTGLAPKTQRLYTKILSCAFLQGRRDQLITHNPFEGLRVTPGQSAERGTFTKGELQLILQAAREKSQDWETVVLLGAFTGQRLRDCTELKWRDVNLAAEPHPTITFRVAKKRGASHTIPMFEQLREHLERISPDSGETHVAPSLTGKETGGAHGLSEEFRRIVKSAGVDMGLAVHSGKRRMSSKSFHSLRHGFVSGLANANIGPELRRKLSGHDDAKSHEGYTRIEQNLLVDAISKLSRL